MTGELRKHRGSQTLALHSSMHLEGTGTLVHDWLQSSFLGPILFSSPFQELTLSQHR